jgi:hypothetical protein
MGRFTWWQWLILGVIVVMIIKSPGMAAHKADQLLGGGWYFLNQLAKFVESL